MTHHIRPPSRPRPRERGMTLIGMVAIMTLLAAFMVIAGHLFTQAMTITRDGTRMEHDITQLDALLRHLRDDLWQASHHHADDDRVELQHPDETTITWHIARDEDPSGDAVTTVTRHSTREIDRTIPQRFTLGPQLRIEAQDAGIRLHVGEQSTTLVSPLQLLKVQP